MVETVTVLAAALALAAPARAEYRPPGEGFVSLQDVHRADHILVVRLADDVKQDWNAVRPLQQQPVRDAVYAGLPVKGAVLAVLKGKGDEWSPKRTRETEARGAVAAEPGAAARSANPMRSPVVHGITLAVEALGCPTREAAVSLLQNGRTGADAVTAAVIDGLFWNPRRTDGFRPAWRLRAWRAWTRN